MNKSKNIEPTYLRYIYDGLVKGSIHPENAAELPDGLIGLYDEAFDERTSVVERQTLLERFAIWALLKKEVSVAFVAEVLEESENDILEFINTYASWFNSPESGKYKLYHERLKVYLLQKLSEHEVHKLHEKLISRLEQAIEEQKADEFEWYGLEFLAGHLSIRAMLSGDGNQLIKLAYSQTHWQRQLKISKGYTWTKNGLKEVMSWASKYNENEVIECGLQMVDLHHQEQNTATEIVALVAEGDFDAALKRIEQFGGNDKEGLQRKFILYVLCLMELTLLDSKNKPFRKDGIEKLLKHLDDQLPVDHSVLNWSEFFSGNIIFNMSCHWNELGIGYSEMYSRSDENWSIELINEKEQYSELEYKVLTNIVLNFNSTAITSKVLLTIFFKMKNEVNHREALEIKNKVKENVNSITHEEEKSRTLEKLCDILVQNDEIEEALEYFVHITSEPSKSRSSANIVKRLIQIKREKEALSLANNINLPYWKIVALTNISDELVSQGEMFKTAAILKKAHVIASKIKDKADKDSAYENISQAWAYQGAIDQSFKYIQDIKGSQSKSEALKNLSIELAKSGKIKKALDYSKNILINSDKASAIIQIANEILIDGNKRIRHQLIDKAVKIARGTDHAMSEVAIKIAQHGEFDRAIAYALEISDNQYWRSCTLEAIVKILLFDGNIDKALYCSKLIYHDDSKATSFLRIANKYSVSERYKELFIFLLKKIEFKLESTKQQNLNLDIISCLSFQLAMTNVAEIALIPFELIDDEHIKFNSIVDLANTFFLNKDFTESLKTVEIGLNLIKNNSDNILNCMIYSKLSTILFLNGQKNESNTIMQLAFDTFKKIDEYSDTSEVIHCISKELAKQERLDDALFWANSNDYISYIAVSLIDIAIEMNSQRYDDEIINNLISKAQIHINHLEDCQWTTNLISDLSNKLIGIGKVDHAFCLAERNLIVKSSLLKDLSLNNWFIDLKLEIAEVLEQTNLLDDQLEKSQIYKNLAIVSVHNENWSEMEKLSSMITITQEQQNFWFNAAQIILENKGYKNVLTQSKKIKRNDLKFFFFNGFINRLKFSSVNQELSWTSICILIENTEILEKLINLRFVNQLFLENITPEKVQHFNHTLNIQWAIDIKNQLN
jgi:hypothetical protein